MKKQVHRWVFVVSCLVFGASCPSLCQAGAEDQRQAHQRPVYSIEQFRFVGNDADRVGPEKQEEPNGVPDAHFQLTLAASTNVAIRSIMIRAANGGVWSLLLDQTRWTIGLYVEGKQIPPRNGEPLLAFQGEQMLDLYIEPNAGFFGSGAEFQITIHLADGPMLVAHCKVLWQDLAQPKGGSDAAKPHASP